MSTSKRTVSRRAFVQSGAAGVLTATAYGQVVGANERVGVGFIGYGLIGKRHVLDFRAEKDVRLVALAETHERRLNEGLGEMGQGAQGYRDFRRLLERKDIDAVVISTPDHWHALQSMLACAAGKDVYVEKPLTLFVREGRWMIDLANRHQRIVQVGTQQRSGLHYQRARQLLRDGHIGRVHAVRMTSFRNIMPGFGRPADADPPKELDWDMWLGPAPRRPYNPNRCICHFRWFWDYSGGQMTNLGAHSLDLVHWFLGFAGPGAVSSSGGRFSLTDSGETPDTQDSFFEYPQCNVVWSHREACAGQRSQSGMELCGPLGSLTISRRGFTVHADPLVPPENAIPQFAGAHPAGGPQSVKNPEPGRLRTKPMEDISGSTLQQFQRHVRDFLDCIRTRRQPVSDLESAHRVTTACHLANISLRLGKKLRWN
ncbi:MAG: Gfo/Idh/MocA family oxidoreductase, partial [Gemmataceae bacterium]|nr:Gfo/Idh/MocA family oxidoreductase [Gemmataceae bacterium]